MEVQWLAHIAEIEGPHLKTGDKVFLSFSGCSELWVWRRLWSRAAQADGGARS